MKKQIKNVKVTNIKNDAQVVEDVEELNQIDSQSEEVEAEVANQDKGEIVWFKNKNKQVLTELISDYNKLSNVEEMKKFNSMLINISNKLEAYNVLNVMDISKEESEQIIKIMSEAIKDAESGKGDVKINLPKDNNNDNLILAIWYLLTASVDTTSKSITSIGFITKMQMLETMSKLGETQANIVFREARKCVELLNDNAIEKEILNNKGNEMNTKTKENIEENYKVSLSKEDKDRLCKEYLEDCKKSKKKKQKETLDKYTSTTTKLLLGTLVVAAGAGLYYAHKEGYLSTLNPFSSVDTTEVEEAVETAVELM